MPDPAAPDGARLDRVFLIGLGIVAGFVDAFGFLRLHGLLTAHTTGNLVFLAIGLAQGDAHVIMKFLAVPIFVVGVGFSTAFITRVTRYGGRPLAYALALESVLLAVCILFGVVLPPAHGPDDLAACCVGTTAILAMAVQNTVMRLLLKQLPLTTAMTSNTTEAMIQWTHAMIGFGQRQSPEDVANLFGRARTMGITIAAFVTGGICGALSAIYLGYPGLAMPIGVLLALVAVTTAA
jgi:uncharacterized membrane protein YoaK (UPF0700 family)